MCNTRILSDVLFRDPPHRLDVHVMPRGPSLAVHARRRPPKLVLDIVVGGGNLTVWIDVFLESCPMSSGTPKMVMTPHNSGCRSVRMAKGALLAYMGMPIPMLVAQPRSSSCTSTSPGQYVPATLGRSSVGVGSMNDNAPSVSTEVDMNGAVSSPSMQ